MNSAAYLHLGSFPAPRVTTIKITDAPAALNGMRVLFASDVHLRRSVSDAKLEALIHLISAQNADLFLLGGDYGEGAPQCLRFFDAIRALRFPMGKFAVPGNNDDPIALAHGTERADAQLLINRSVALQYRGTRFLLGGCDDHKYGKPETAHLFDGEDGYRIFLSHFPVLPDCVCNLQFSGHTHGGQVSLFGFSAYNLKFENKYGITAIRGEHAVKTSRLIVSNGIGISKFPVRFGAPPEIIVAEFLRNPLSSGSPLIP